MDRAYPLAPWAPKGNLGKTMVRRRARWECLVGAMAVWVPQAVLAGDAGLGATAALHVESETQSVLVARIEVPPGYHLWSLDPGDGPKALVLELEGKGFAREKNGVWHGSTPVVAYDRGFERKLAHYPAGVALFATKVSHQPGQQDLPRLVLSGQICNETHCLDQKLSVPVERKKEPFKTAMWSEPPLSVRPKAASLLAGWPRSSAAPSAEENALPESLPVAGVSAGAQALAQAKNKGVWAFILMAFAFGLAALATPCVFPAIPLTVSFFSKYSGESLGRGARLAAVYALTMVASFSGAGVLISILFGVTGVQRFAAHPIFNLFLGALLGLFSLNLLGLFDIRAPAWMTRGANRLEAKFGRGAALGNGAKKSGGLGDYLVVSVAALTATTVFFTCTVAFVGLVLVEAAQGAWFWPTVGMLAFSSAFALPFFVLALFPSAANRLRGTSGQWLEATRVTLGFLELAAATKFVSNADLIWSWGMLTREVVLAFWIPLFGIAGLYLLGKLKIGAQSLNTAEGGASVVQVMASTVFFGVALYLGAGFLQGRAFGGWVDGWLPPVVYPGTAARPGLAKAGRSENALKWTEDLRTARRQAEKEGRLVFVNYTGYSCTNCRYMEGAVFTQPNVAALLNNMVLVELYTDGGTEAHQANREDQAERFGTVALPHYSVERPSGSVVGTFPSSTNDPEEFRRFLEEALKKGKTLEESASAKKLALKTTQLSDGSPASAIEAGHWTLINFWATWCAPCREELKAFMVELGRDFEAQGHRFRTVAVEADDGVVSALKFMRDLRVPPRSALRVSSEYTDHEVDPRLDFDGSLPYTVLISPAGEVVWKHKTKISEAQLKRILAEYTGYASAHRLGEGAGTRIR